MKTILVVDDDADLRGVLRLVLQREGYSVLEAGNGVAALGILESRPVDLVITDIFMPEMGGLGTLQAMRRNRRDIPVFAMSGGADRTAQEPLDQARRLGAARTFVKPFDVAEVVAAVREFTGPEAGRA